MKDFDFPIDKIQAQLLVNVIALSSGYSAERVYMANPSPAHNPTDGLGSAVYVQLSGTNVTPYLTPSANHPNPAHYSVTLSLSGAGGFASSVVITPSLVDVSDAAYAATAASWVYNSYNNPQVTEASFRLARAIRLILIRSRHRPRNSVLSVRRVLRLLLSQDFLMVKP